MSKETLDVDHVYRFVTAKEETELKCCMCSSIKPDGAIYIYIPTGEGLCQFHKDRNDEAIWKGH